MLRCRKQLVLQSYLVYVQYGAVMENVKGRQKSGSSKKRYTNILVGQQVGTECIVSEIVY